MTAPRERRREATVVFADLAGFTALTEAHGDEQAVDEAVAFSHAVRSALPAAGRLVKTMGDGVFVLLPDPVGAFEFLAEMADVLRSGGSLEVRAGVHHGAVVEQEGDVFGGTVNIAARLLGLASSHQVMTSGHVARAAKAAGYRITSLGVRSLRHLSEPIEVFEVDVLPAREDASVVDPVCRMAIPEDRVVGQLRFAEQLYQFCSLDCIQRFAAHPERFATSAETT